MSETIDIAGLASQVRALRALVESVFLAPDQTDLAGDIAPGLPIKAADILEIEEAAEAALPASGGVMTGPLLIGTNTRLGTEMLRVAGGAVFDTITVDPAPLIILPIGGVPPLGGFDPSTALYIQEIPAASLALTLDGYAAVPTVRGRRSAGTPAAPLPTNLNTRMLQLEGHGYDGVVHTMGTMIVLRGAETGAWTPTAHGALIQFWTTAAGTTTLSEKMRLADTGALLINTTLPVAGEKLNVAGSAIVSGPLLVNATAPVSTEQLRVTGGANIDSLLVNAAAPVSGEKLRVIGGANIDTLTAQLSQTAAPLTVNSSGRVPAQSLGTGGGIWVLGTDTLNTRVYLDSFGTAAGVFGGRAAPGVADNLGTSGIASGRNMTVLQMQGWDGAAYYTAGSIQLLSEEAFTATNGGSAIRFMTTQIGTRTSGERARINNAGALLIGTTAQAGSEKLGVVGGFDLDTLFVQDQAVTGGTLWVRRRGDPVAGPLPPVPSESMLTLAPNGSQAALSLISLNSPPQLIAASTVGSWASPQPVPSGYPLFQLLNGGYDGGQWIYQAEAMRVSADATWTAGHRPTRLAFFTAGTNDLGTERLRITSAGAVLVNATAQSAGEIFRVVGGAVIDMFNTPPYIPAIAGTSPLSLSQSSPTPPAAGVGTGTVLYGQSATPPAVTLDANASVSTTPPAFRGRATRGTFSSPQASSATSQFVALDGQGYDGSAFASGGQVLVRSAEGWNSGAHGTYLTFLTTQAGTTALTERLRLTDAGALQFAITGPSISVGAGAPTSTQPAGSIYMRTDGAAGSRVYVNQGGTTWTPIAGV